MCLCVSDHCDPMKRPCSNRIGRVDFESTPKTCVYRVNYRLLKIIIWLEWRLRIHIIHIIDFEHLQTSYYGHNMILYMKMGNRNEKEQQRCIRDGAPSREEKTQRYWNIIYKNSSCFSMRQRRCLCSGRCTMMLWPCCANVRKKHRHLDSLQLKPINFKLKTQTGVSR